MKRFKRHKTFDEIKTQCKAAGIHFSDHLYKITGSDWLVITTIKGDNDSGQRWTCWPGLRPTSE